MSTTIQKIYRAQAVTLAVTIDELTSCLNINQGSSYQNIYDEFGVQKISNRQLSKQLTKELKSKRSVDIKSSDVYSTVSTTKAYIYQYELKSKCQNMEWRHIGPPKIKNIKALPRARKKQLQQRLLQ